MSKRYRRQPGELQLPILTKGRLEQLASVPICAYVGYNGMGKSAAAAAVAMMHLDAGRPVLSTARLLDYNNPRPCDDITCVSPHHGEAEHRAAHPLWTPLTDYRQLFTWRKGHVWLDEATGVADARSHQSMPGEVADYLPRLRVSGVTCHWTTIHWSFADVRLRRVTLAVVGAVGSMPVYVGDEIWGRNRLFRYRVYDAKNLTDDFDPSSPPEDVRPMVRAWVWGPRSRAFGGYASHEGVISLGGTDESGMCMTCGGQRGKKRCPGHGPDDGPPARVGRGRRTRPDGPQRSEDRPDGTADPAAHDPWPPPALDLERILRDDCPPAASPGAPHGT